MKFVISAFLLLGSTLTITPSASAATGCFCNVRLYNVNGVPGFFKWEVYGRLSNGQLSLIDQSRDNFSSSQGALNYCQSALRSEFPECR